MTVAKCIYGNNINKPLLNKNSLRTSEAQFVPKLKNNDVRPKFTGSYKKKSVYLMHIITLVFTGRTWVICPSVPVSLSVYKFSLHYPLHTKQVGW